MNPRSGSTETSRTRTRSPTSSSSAPSTTLPSTGGSTVLTQVPLGLAPVTSPSNTSPSLPAR